MASEKLLENLCFYTFCRIIIRYFSKIVIEGKRGSSNNTECSITLHLAKQHGDVTASRILLQELLKLDIDHGMRHADDPILLEDQDYDDTEYHWYQIKASFTFWLIFGTILLVLAIFLLVARIACCLTNKRGRGPVLRPPLILRPGLIDNKNCGLVYKPLQEEIATPHMPKRGSFYSSSTFHYDKIVPESV